MDRVFYIPQLQLMETGMWTQDEVLEFFRPVRDATPLLSYLFAR
jgi:hypothetical protein